MSKKERINIRNLKVIRGYNLVSLRNNQRLLMKDSKIYNISPYSDCYDIFEIGNRLCAIVPSYTENHKENLIDLNTMEVLLTADSIKVNDDKTVIVIDNLCKFLYNVETNTCIYGSSEHDLYQYDYKLDNQLYVFERQKDSFNEKCSNRNVVDQNGRVLLNSEEGYIYGYGDYIIINNKGVTVAKINEDKSVSIIHNIEKTDEMLIKPTYCEGKIVIVENGLLKTYTPDMKLINQFKMEKINFKNIEYEYLVNVLYIIADNKWTFIDINTGKTISHLFVDFFDKWSPETYIGQDTKDAKLVGDNEEPAKTTEYHFYDSNLDKTLDIEGTIWGEVFGYDDNKFIVTTEDGEKYVNNKTKTIKDCNYDVVEFNFDSPYGIAYNKSDNDYIEQMHIIDGELNDVYPCLDYSKYKLHNNFKTYLINNHLCLFIQNGSHISYVLLDPIGNEIYYSEECKNITISFRIIGDYIEIIDEYCETYYYDTLNSTLGIFDLYTKIDGLSTIDYSNAYIKQTQKSIICPSLDGQTITKKLSKR